MLTRDSQSARPRPTWPLIGAGVVILLVAVGIVVVALGGSHKAVKHQARPTVAPAPKPPPSQVVVTAQGLVAEPPDIRSAMEAVMPPEMRSALGSPTVQRSWQSWVGTFPYGEHNWSYSWALNGVNDFRLMPTGVTKSRGVYAIVSTFDTEQTAIQGFRFYEKGGTFISAIRSSAFCGTVSNECHYYNARSGMGNGSFDLPLHGPPFVISNPPDSSDLEQYNSNLDQQGVLVGARFKNVAVYVYWYGIDIPPGTYSNNDINKGTPLPYPSALSQGIAYVKAIIARL